MHQISVSIPLAQSEYSRMGLKSTVFVVQIMDCGIESAVVLDDFDFQYLHEELSRQPGVHECIQIFPKRSFSLFESTACVEQRRIQYERYLQFALSSAGCVGARILWVTLGLSPPSSVVPRFLLRGDNLSELDELSSHATELHRLCNVSTLLTLQHYLPDSVPILFRVASDRASHRVVIESGLLKALLLHKPPSRLITSLLLFLVEFNPNALFVFLQHDMSELIESLSEKRGLELSSLAQTLLMGALSSTDVEITLTDKSSLGMSLLNKLLVQGRDTETELVVGCLLCYLLKRNLVHEYSEKIATIVDSIVERRNTCPAELGLKISEIFLGKKNSPIHSETVIKLGAFLANNFSAAGGLTPRLHQLISSNELSGATKTLLAEALVHANRAGENEVKNRAKMVEEYSQNRTQIDGLVLAKISSEMVRVNNFLIQVNFEISNKGVGELANVSQVASEMAKYFASVESKSDEVMRLDSVVHATHSEAMNIILRSMLEVKSHLAEIERIRRESAALDAEIQAMGRKPFEEIQAAAKELAAMQKQRVEFHQSVLQTTPGFDDKTEVDGGALLSALRGADKTFLETIEKMDAGIAAKQNEIEKTFNESKLRELEAKCGNLKTRMIELSLASASQQDLVGSLSQAASEIDENLTQRNEQLRATKSVLLKIQNAITMFIDIIDGDEGTGDYITPDD